VCKKLLKKRKIFGHVTNTSLMDNKCYGSVHSKSERGGWQKENRNKSHKQRSSVIEGRTSVIPSVDSPPPLSGISWNQIKGTQE
jgi:hypothetical protein